MLARREKQQQQCSNGKQRGGSKEARRATAQQLPLWRRRRLTCTAAVRAHDSHARSDCRL
jgi:hypothetical protein